jgi:hypothetical protein
MIFFFIFLARSTSPFHVPISSAQEPLFNTGEIDRQQLGVDEFFQALLAGQQVRDLRVACQVQPGDVARLERGIGPPRGYLPCDRPV